MSAYLSKAVPFFGTASKPSNVSEAKTINRPAGDLSLNRLVSIQDKKTRGNINTK